MWYEIRYLISAPAMLWIYWQYVVVYRCINGAPYLTVFIWLPLGVAFALQNILFNMTFGTFLYWEQPNQWYFSDRIRDGDENRKVRFRRLLNPHDPEHIV